MVAMMIVVIVVIMVVSGSVGYHRWCPSVCEYCWYQDTPIVPMLATSVVMMVMMTMVMLMIVLMLVNNLGTRIPRLYQCCPDSDLRSRIKAQTRIYGLGLRPQTRISGLGITV